MSQPDEVAKILEDAYQLGKADALLKLEAYAHDLVMPKMQAKLNALFAKDKEAAVLAGKQQERSSVMAELQAEVISPNVSEEYGTLDYDGIATKLLEYVETSLQTGGKS